MSTPQPPPAAPTGRAGTVAVGTGRVLLGLLLVASTLRSPLAVVPPLVPQVQRDLGLGGAAAGALTTLPVLAMGLAAPAAAVLGRRLGPARAVGLAVMLVAVGLAVRLLAGAPALYVGVLVAGLGIAVAGPLLPGVVKARFAERSGTVSGAYVAVMMAAAALAGLVAVPTARALGGWPAAMAVWALPAALALVVWWPLARSLDTERPSPPADPEHRRLPWGSATAWLVATQLLLNSIGFYGALAWVAASYEAVGLPAARAGALVGVLNGAQLVTGFAAPWLADRVRDRRPLLVGLTLLAGVGFAGLAWQPLAAPALWVLLVGLGLGGGFALSLVLVVDYAPSPAGSERLTALVFLVAFTGSAFTPAVLGAVRDATGGFVVPWLLLLAVTVVALPVLLRLGPDRRV